MDWVYLIEVLVGGLMSGVMYSLVAIGFVLIYKSSGIFNFAQGTMLLFASLTFVKMTENGIDFWTALFIAAGIMVIFGVATERYVIRPLANQDLLALFMATVGLATFQEGFSQFIWDSDVHGLQMSKFLDIGLLDPAPIFMSDHIPWLDILIPKFDIFASLVAGSLIVVLAFFFQKTKTGLSLRAVSDDHMAAMAVGIPLQTVWAVVWAVTGVIALVAIGVFMTVFSIIMFFFPEGGGYFIEMANFQEANPLVTPEHIAPVWYYAPFYTMLRAIPDPLGGLIVMAAAVAIFFIVPWLDRSKVASIRYKGIYSKIALTMFGVSFLTLGYLGTVGVTEIRKTMSVICTIIYFSYFLLMPIYTKYEITKEVPKRL